MKIIALLRFLILEIILHDQVIQNPVKKKKIKKKCTDVPVLHH